MEIFRQTLQLCVTEDGPLLVSGFHENAIWEMVPVAMFGKAMLNLFYYKALKCTEMKIGGMLSTKNQKCCFYNLNMNGQHKKLNVDFIKISMF